RKSVVVVPNSSYCSPTESLGRIGEIYSDQQLTTAELEWCEMGPLGRLSHPFILVLLSIGATVSTTNSLDNNLTSIARMTVEKYYLSELLRP
ncbi:Hypothetical predicted protein, partial [Olea europaea subsp. europaea]